jgi:anti-sigma-K factor RskA
LIRLEEDTQVHLIKWSSNDEGEGDMNCQEFEELFGAYTLDALSAEERQVVDLHLVTCTKCKRTVEQLQEIVDLFPLSVPAIEPPPLLKAQIMAHIQTAQATYGTLPPPERAIVHSRRRRLRWQNSLLAASLLLLLVLLGGMTFWNLSLHEQVALLSTRVPQPVTYTIHGINGSTATGEVIYYPQQQITVLLLRDLPPLTGAQVYQGWLFQGQHPVSIGLLNRENGTVTLDFQGEISKYSVAAVSLERGPRPSRTPKGLVVAMGFLQGS